MNHLLADLSHEISKYQALFSFLQQRRKLKMMSAANL